MTAPMDLFPRPAWEQDATADPRARTLPTVGGGPDPAGTARQQHLEVVTRMIRPARHVQVEDPVASAAAERAQEQNRPRTVRLGGTATAPGGATVVFPIQPIGQPELGFTWMLRRLHVGPADYSNPGAAWTPTHLIVVLGPLAMPNIAVPDSAERMVTSTTNTILEATWGRGEVTILPGDQLWVIITGLAAGAIASAGGQVEEIATAGRGV